MTSPRDQISKASWVLLQSVKDKVASNVIAASQSGQIDTKNLNLERLLMIVNASVEEGFHRAHRSFLGEVDKTLASVTSDAEPKKK